MGGRGFVEQRRCGGKVRVKEVTGKTCCPQDADRPDVVGLLKWVL